MPDELNAHKVEQTSIDQLKPHPRNYKQHPEDQIEHIVQSIKENGFYRNVVVARDGTILAGHGVVTAAQRMGFKKVPTVRLDIDADDPRALKVMAGDNEISHLAQVDDRALSELLREVKDQDLSGLLGTGYDEMMLANLLMVTRPRSEITTFDEAAAWVGMPDYTKEHSPINMVMFFANEHDFKEFVAKTGLKLNPGGKSAWWPERERDDLRTVKLVG